MSTALSITRTLIAAAGGAFLGVGIGILLTLLVALICLIFGVLPSVKYLAITGAVLVAAPAIIFSIVAAWKEIVSIRELNERRYLRAGTSSQTG